MWRPYREVPLKEWQGFRRTFNKKARFLVDENMGREVATVMREFGYNAEFVGDIGLTGHSDQTVFAHAWKKQRIILTHDDDFLNNAHFPFHRNPGVVVLPGADGDGTLEPALADVIRLLAPHGLAHHGAKIEVTQDRVWTIQGFERETGKHTWKRIRLEKHGGVSEWVSRVF